MLGHRTLNMQDYLIILKRHWWIILIPMMILPIVGVAATFFITPDFTSETTVLVEQQKVPDEYVKPVATQDLQSRIAFIEEQVLSRSSIQPIIEKYNLYANDHLSMDQRVTLMRDPKTLKVQPVQSAIARSGGLPGFTIAFTANDPHTAQQVCAEITSLFTSVNLQSREANAAAQTDFLKEQLDGAKRNLDDLDNKVAAFQRQYAGSLPGEENNNMSMMSGLQAQLEATTQQIQSLEQNRSVGETLLAQMPVPTAAGPAPVQTAQVQQMEMDTLLKQKADLEARYSADYPDVKAVNRQIDDLRKEMARAAAPAPAATSSAPGPSRPEPANMVGLRAQLKGIDTQIQAKRKQQDDLRAQLRSYEGRVSATPQIAAQYKELTRDYDTAQTFYNNLLAKMNDSQMTTDLEHRQEGETFSILDAPNLPTEPIFPKRIVFGAGGLGVGLVMGLMIVALVEYRDTALRSERDVWDFTQLPTLAVIAWSGGIADLKPERNSRLKRLFSKKPKDLLADAPG
jgi:polysaccharide chain length determinant protein (PEP-CTERM system associated)